MNKDKAFEEAYFAYMSKKLEPKGGSWLCLKALNENEQAPWRAAFESILKSFPPALSEAQRKLMCSALRSHTYKLAIIKQDLEIAESVPEAQSMIDKEYEQCMELLRLWED